MEMGERSIALNDMQRLKVNIAFKSHVLEFYTCMSATSFGIVQVNRDVWFPDRPPHIQRNTPGVLDLF